MSYQRKKCKSGINILHYLETGISLSCLIYLRFTHGFYCTNRLPTAKGVSETSAKMHELNVWVECMETAQLSGFRKEWGNSIVLNFLHPQIIKLLGEWSTEDWNNLCLNSGNWVWTNSIGCMVPLDILLGVYRSIIIPFWLHGSNYIADDRQKHCKTLVLPLSPFVVLGVKAVLALSWRC